MMNSQERVRAALQCQVPDRIPFCFGFFAQSLPGIGDVDEYFGGDVRFARFSPPPAQDDFLAYLRGLPEHVHVGNLDQLRIYHEWGYRPELGTARPLSEIGSLDDLIDYALPDLSHPSRHAGLKAQVRHWHEQGLAVAGAPPHLGGELFETAWRLRGFDNFILDLVEHKNLAHYLLDQLAAMMRHNALVLAQAGIDVLLLDDDVAMPTGLMIGLPLWREFFKPRMAQVIELAREAAPEILVFYHSDGDFTRLLPDLIEIGVDVVNPLQPDCMDATAIKTTCGDRLALWGTVGSATVWDEGTPDQIRAEVRARIETLGPSGLLLAPAYDIDFAPMENVAAFVEAVDAFGQTH